MYCNLVYERILKPLCHGPGLAPCYILVVPKNVVKPRNNGRGIVEVWNDLY